MRKFFAISLVFLLVACSHGMTVPVYYLDSHEKHALIRKQAGEVRPYSESPGYQCSSQAEFEQLMFWLSQCRLKKRFGPDLHLDLAGVTKMHILNELEGGLVSRDEPKEVIPFEKAHGYICLAPLDFRAIYFILERCQD